MPPPVHVKIGDTVEFANAPGSFTAGRVVDVNPAEPELCTVQVSAYEPLQTVDLLQCAYKVPCVVCSILWRRASM